MVAAAHGDIALAEPFAQIMRMHPLGDERDQRGGRAAREQQAQAGNRGQIRAQSVGEGGDIGGGLRRQFGDPVKRFCQTHGLTDGRGAGRNSVSLTDNTAPPPPTLKGSDSKASRRPQSTPMPFGA